jgi:hypothetical protein
MIADDTADLTGGSVLARITDCDNLLDIKKPPSFVGQGLLEDHGYPTL